MRSLAGFQEIQNHHPALCARPCAHPTTVFSYFPNKRSWPLTVKPGRLPGLEAWFFTVPDFSVKEATASYSENRKIP